jgi:hypothetical protein
MIKFLALYIFYLCIINNLYYAFVISTRGEIFNGINKISPLVEMTEKKLDHRVLYKVKVFWSPRFILDE